MPIKIQCLACGKEYSIGDKLLGKKVRCKCGIEFEVPKTTSPADTDNYPLLDDLVGADPLGPSVATGLPLLSGSPLMPLGQLPGMSNFNAPQGTPRSRRKEPEFDWSGLFRRVASWVGPLIGFLLVMALITWGFSKLPFVKRQQEANKQARELTERWAGQDDAIARFLELGEITKLRPNWTRSGRFVVLDADARQIDFEVMGNLPPGLAARAADDVENVVLLRFSTEIVGQYSDDRLAMAQVAHVRVVDPAKSLLILDERIQGPDPPRKIREGDSGGVVIGDKPINGIVKLLVELSAAEPIGPSAAPEAPMVTSEDQVREAFAAWSADVDSYDYVDALAMMDEESIRDTFVAMLDQYCLIASTLKEKLPATVLSKHFDAAFVERYLACPGPTEKFALVREACDPAQLLAEASPNGNPGWGFLAAGSELVRVAARSQDAQGRAAHVVLCKRKVDTRRDEHYEMHVTFRQDAAGWRIAKIVVIHVSHEPGIGDIRRMIVK